MHTASHQIRHLALALLLAGSTGVSAQLINVEVDYMEQTGAGAHTHKLLPDEVAAVEQMFACHGLTLNIVVDDAIPHLNTIKTAASSADFFSGFGTQSFKAIKDTYFDHASSGDWHYAVFGHNYALGGVTLASSGLGEIGGDDLVVTLATNFTGGIGTPFDRASTFAHELGHNLGLDHEPLYDPLGLTGNNSPIYASVMSYAYQLQGVRSGLREDGLIGDLSLFKELDYSNGRLPLVLESQLKEDVGVGITPTDWDCDNVIDGSAVSQQLDGDADSDGSWCGEVGVPYFLRDQDDWAVIAAGLASDAVMAPRTSEPCASPPVSRGSEQGSQDVTLVQPTLTTEACVSAEMYWVAVGSPLSGTGSGSDPAHLIVMVAGPAIGTVPDGSILYLQPGTHNNGGTPVLITTALFLDGPGGAVIDP